MNIKELLNLNYYTSELDQFLIDFDHQHPKRSASQRAEKEKYDGIYHMRDNPDDHRPPHEEMWDKF